MSAVLAETLVWTGVLIAAVLLLRRPVAQWFGPQIAYALWALPVLRLIVPPVTLPAWMAPSARDVAAPELAERARLAEPVAWEAEGMPASFTLEASPPAEPGFDLFALLADPAVLHCLLAVWLVGAGVFLLRRFGAYFELRDTLLAEGREMGRMRGLIMPIRLIETPATTAPLAMGVLAPVIALPPGFMALHDRQARDLALAHELAHHRGGDLLVNVLVQPLFALHWFNPLGRYGWLALRRDQEAACDARVMAQRSDDERAAYATLIARFAAAPGATTNAALTAPMACPVLGEKSIIHRLRSLSMSHISLRRRFAGAAMLGAGVLALPLTASISYAAADASQEAPEPPVPPSAPQAPDAPEPPAAPEAPDAPSIMMIDPDAPEGEENVEVIERVVVGEDGKEKRVRMVLRGGPGWTARGEDGAAAHAVHADAAHREAMASVEVAMAELDRVREDMPRIMAEAFASAEAARGEGHPRIIVKRECRPGSKEVSETTEGKDGTQIISICQSRIFAEARSGLEEARAEIAADSEIPEDTRKQILQQLDRQIERWKDKEG
jgi:beta-lactamase regulating signal transducer with metallopeptidase domain